MSHRQIIRRNAVIDKALMQELTLPGEPLIYSVRYAFGNRKLPERYFRNKQFASLIKCYFPKYMNTSIPLAIIVRFYVSPPENIELPQRDLKNEKRPAVHTHELCDYLLSFMEMLLNVVFKTYKQVVKIDCEKYYSNNPRTIFKFMRYENYVNLSHSDTLYAETQEIRTPRIEELLQSQRERGEGDRDVCQGGLKEQGHNEATPISEATLANDHALPSTMPKKLKQRKAQTVQRRHAPKPPGWGQPGEVPQ